MKILLLLGTVLLAALTLGGCVSSSSSAPATRPSAGAHCLSRPDTSGTQPLFYLLCIQSN
jgi:hypothetical protein